MKKIKISLNNFKGLSELGFELDTSINSHLIYAPNGTGKSSMMTSLSGKKINKKNALTGLNTSVSLENKEKMEFICFESFSNKDLTYGKQLFLDTMEDEDRVNSILSELDKEIEDLPKLKLLKISYGEKFQYEIIKDIKEKKIDKKIGKASLVDIEFYRVFFSKNTNKKEINQISFNDLIIFIDKYKNIMSKDNVSLTQNVRDVSRQQCINLLKIAKKENDTEFIKQLSNRLKKLENDSNLQNNKILQLKDDFKKNKLLNEKEVIIFIEDNIDYLDDIKTIELLFEKKDIIEKQIVDEYHQYSCKVIDYVNEYNRIKEKEKNDDLDWRSVCEEYNSIFINSPIRFKLEKSHDRISKKSTNKIVFSIKNPLNEKFINISEKFLWSELSVGEQKSLYFFDMMHKVREYIKRYGDNVFFVFDDVVDSLDDLNLMALTYYFKKLEKNSIKFLILTHNYSFYNILGKKIKNNKKMLIMIKSNDGKVTFKEREKNNEDILKVLINPSIFNKSPEYLIAALPVIREIQKISLDNNDSDNEIIKYFHIKKETEITIYNDLITFMMKKIKYNNNDESIFENKSTYLHILDERCNYILNTTPSCIIEELVFKICLALGIRLMLEKKIIDNIPDFQYDIDSYQTTNLILKYSEQLGFETLDLVKYEMASSNIIHLNSLNYEILFYYNLDYIKKTYIELKKLKI